jgi:hypothetical protein
VAVEFTRPAHEFWAASHPVPAMSRNTQESATA